MNLLSNVLYLLILVFVSPWILVRAIKHGRYLRGWKAKLLGIHIPPAGKACNSPAVWLHAVSVGEVQLLRSIVPKIQQERPDLRIVISTSTDSGFALASELFRQEWVIYAPLDFTWAIRNTWKAIHPSLVVLMELEIWPNWLKFAESQNCPVVVVNGRLSDRSFRGYSRIRFWLAPILRTLDWVGAQNREYASRFASLGVADDRIRVTGSIKFDGTEPDRQSQEVEHRRTFLHLPPRSSHLQTITTPTSETLGVKQIDPPIFVWVAGSTQDPEEELILETFLQLSSRFPNLKLILVPRHPERFEQVASLINNSGVRWARRSECREVPPNADWQVFLGDTVGELRWWWGLADLGFVGGSFGDRGGQNMLEPCAYGVATSFGPNTKNFRDIVYTLLQANACTQLSSPSELAPWVERMLTDNTTREGFGSRAQATVMQHRGALARTWESLEKFLPPPNSPGGNPRNGNLSRTNAPTY